MDKTYNEIIRQALHVLLGLGITILFWKGLISPLDVFWLLVLLGSLSYMTKKFHVPVLWDLVRKFEREEDMDFPGRGPIFLVLGILISMKIFPESIALVSMSVVSIGDAFSHLYGQVFGKFIFKSQKGRKNIEGTIAGIVLSVPFAYYFGGLAGIFGAVAGMLAEFVDIDMNKKPVNDNLAVPLAAGAAMLVLKKIFSA